MARLSIVQQQMKEMLDHHSHLKDINLEDTALPKEQNKCQKHHHTLKLLL